MADLFSGYLYNDATSVSETSILLLVMTTQFLVSLQGEFPNSWNLY